jgi:hypothetical protein
VSRYRYRAFCTECRESNDALLGDTRDWEAAHDAKHRRGKCRKCGHWNDHHIATDEPMRGYLRSDRALVCVKGVGMGVFCGCSGDDYCRELFGVESVADHVEQDTP